MTGVSTAGREGSWRVAVVLAALLLVVGRLACREKGETRAGASGGPTGSEERARNASPCPSSPVASGGATEGGEVYVRGRVVVPDTVGAGVDGGERRAENDAGRAAIGRRFRPARDVRVTLYRNSDENEPRRLASGRTDHRGRWCLMAARSMIRPGTYASARVDSTRLRRPVALAVENRISVDTEALTRLIVERTGGASTLSRSTLLNATSMAASAVDLLEPIDWQSVGSVDEAVEHSLEALRRDRRLATRLAQRDPGGEATESE